MRKPQGSVVIKNVSGSNYAVEELGGKVMAPGTSLDLMDRTVEHHYVDWEAANRLVTELTTAKLYQDIKTGTILVTVNRWGEPGCSSRPVEQ